MRVAPPHLPLILGTRDEHRRLIQRELKALITVRKGILYVSGPDTAVQQTKQLLEQMSALVATGAPLTHVEVSYLLSLIKEGKPLKDPRAVFGDTVLMTEAGRRVQPKSTGQKTYVDAVRSHDLVFVTGVAGTGKTYLAMAMGLAALKSKEVSRLMLVRPAVEAGERLGYLPGDLQEKVDPYLRPLYDALYDMVTVDKVHRNIERKIIEVVPLAYMRGRTLNDAFIVLDEAQNTTPLQMKMFLTRLGFGSKAIVTGDVTQVDLPTGTSSGLLEVQGILDEVEGIAFIELNERDVVRHPLVQRMVKAYEKWESNHK